MKSQFISLLVLRDLSTTVAADAGSAFGIMSKSHATDKKVVATWLATHRALEFLGEMLFSRTRIGRAPAMAEVEESSCGGNGAATRWARRHAAIIHRRIAIAGEDHRRFYTENCRRGGLLTCSTFVYALFVTVRRTPHRTLLLLLQEEEEEEEEEEKEEEEGLKAVVAGQANRDSDRAKEIHLVEIPFNPGIRLEISPLAFKALHIMAQKGLASTTSESNLYCTLSSLYRLEEIKLNSTVSQFGIIVLLDCNANLSKNPDGILLKKKVFAILQNTISFQIEFTGELAEVGVEIAQQAKKLIEWNSIEYLRSYIRNRSQGTRWENGGLSRRRRFTSCALRENFIVQQILSVLVNQRRKRRILQSFPAYPSNLALFPPTVLSDRRLQFGEIARDARRTVRIRNERDPAE
ncbi:hypothetical protein G5I_11956 [Acromyrmex echinatior]|uniref:Uncharacterized protein n=1 Tax=Acromyrmex echinatior TaxID=103372 RepID=F4X101_ACREC|nr:hypothetical protein G5I_11956 [Acromyrmex echinatior]